MKLKNLILVSMIALGCCFGSTAAIAQAKQKVVLVMSGGGFYYLPHFIAEAAGFYAAEGLDPEVVNVPSGKQIMAAIVGGSGDVGLVGLQHYADVVAQGGDVVALGTLYDIYPMQLVLSTDALKKKGITPGMSVDETVKRLQGLRIATTGPGTGTELLVRTLLITRGMDPDKDLSLRPVRSGAPMIAAMTQGLVDGFVHVPPTTTLVERQNTGRMVINPLLGNVPELQDVPYLVVGSTRATVLKKRDLLIKTTRAIARASQLARDKPEEAQRSVRQLFKTMEDGEYRETFIAFAKGFPTSPIITAEQLKKTLVMNNLSAPVKINPSYASVVDPSLATEVAKSLTRKN